MNRKKFSALVISVMLLAELSISAALPVSSWADSETHYIAVASDRHTETTAIAEAMNGMPESVEYVCLDGDMSSFEHRPRPQNTQQESGSGDNTADTSGTSANADQSAGTEGGAGESVQADAGTAENSTQDSTASDGSTATDPAAGSSSEDGGLTARPAAKQQPYNTSDVLKEVQGVFPGLDADDVSIIYASHDSNATDDAGIMKCADTDLLPSSDAADHPEISEGQSGLIHTGPDDAYYIYGVSFQDMRNAEAGQAAAEKFRTWVSSADPSKPVIVIGHVPIHKMRKDNKGATYWNAALNYAATGAADTLAAGLQIVRDVIYLHGHNHGQEPSHSSTEYYKSPGDMMHAEGDDEETVMYYTYITAGYLTTSRTATLLAITDDNISFTKYTGVKGSNEPSLASALGTMRRVHYYTVDFIDSTDDQTILEGNKAVQPQTPSREGYTFDGWYTDAACTRKYDFSTSVTGDVKLYAKWIAQETKPGEAAGPEADAANTENGTISYTDAAEAEEETGRETTGTGNTGSVYSANIVRTGDESGIILWGAVLLTSLFILVILITARVRYNSERRY